MNALEATIAQLETINVTIGSVEDRVTYLIAETQAPKDYDGFGTLSLVEIPHGSEGRNPTRIVLIRSEHANWQIPRYNSGNFAVAKPTGFTGIAVRKHLVEALYKGLGKSRE